MRVSIETSTISLRFVGRALIFAAFVLLAIGTFLRWLLIPGLAFLAGGLPLQRSYNYVVRHSPEAVLQQLTKTLTLMGWRYSRQDTSITVPAVNTAVRITPIFSVSFLSFSFGNKVTAKEKYLVDTLVKYQRFIQR